jgi:hypothetical protein
VISILYYFNNIENKISFHLLLDQSALSGWSGDSSAPIVSSSSGSPLECPNAFAMMNPIERNDISDEHLELTYTVWCQ